MNDDGLEIDLISQKWMEVLIPSTYGRELFTLTYVRMAVVIRFKGH